VSVVGAVFGIAVAAGRYYPIFAWPRNADVGLEVVAGSVVAVFVATDWDRIDEDQYNGYDNADDDSCDRQSNRSVTDSSCTWRVWHRTAACYNCAYIIVALHTSLSRLRVIIIIIIIIILVYYDWRQTAQSTQYNIRHAGRETTATTHGSTIYRRVKPAKLLPHTAHNDRINRTGLTSWTFTRWCDRHTSDKVAHYSSYRPRKDERLSWPWVAGYIPK